MANGTPGSVSKVLAWIMGIIAAVLIGMGGFILQSFHARILVLEASVGQQNTAITRLEVNVSARQERDREIIERLRDMERKIDSIRASDAHWRRQPQNSGQDDE